MPRKPDHGFRRFLLHPSDLGYRKIGTDGRGHRRFDGSLQQTLDRMIDARAPVGRQQADKDLGHDRASHLARPMPTLPDLRHAQRAESQKGLAGHSVRNEHHFGAFGQDGGQGSSARDGCNRLPEGGLS